VADNQIASIDREGDASDKLDALTSYWDGSLNSRSSPTSAASRPRG
jgi:hypothetical protein